MDHPATSDRKGLAVRPHNVAFTVVDLKRARAWYAAALGFELARGNPRAAPHPERGGKPRIGIHLAQLLADPHRQIPFGNDDRATLAVSSGTSGQGLGCIDMTTPFCGRGRRKRRRTLTARKSSATGASTVPQTLRRAAE